MRAILIASVAALAFATPGSAQIQTEIPPPSESAQGDVAVTIYNNDLALVQDRRQLSVPQGRSRQEFPDVSAQIRPETVTLTGDGVGIVEQNFDFDLLSPQALECLKGAGIDRDVRGASEKPSDHVPVWVEMDI